MLLDLFLTFDLLHLWINDQIFLNKVKFIDVLLSYMKFSLHFKIIHFPLKLRCLYFLLADSYLLIFISSYFWPSLAKLLWNSLLFPLSLCSLCDFLWHHGENKVPDKNFKMKQSSKETLTLPNTPPFTVSFPASCSRRNYQHILSKNVNKFVLWADPAENAKAEKRKCQTRGKKKQHNNIFLLVEQISK